VPYNGIEDLTKKEDW